MESYTRRDLRQMVLFARVVAQLVWRVIPGRIYARWGCLPGL